MTEVRGARADKTRGELFGGGSYFSRAAAAEALREFCAQRRLEALLPPLGDLDAKPFGDMAPDIVPFHRAFTLREVSSGRREGRTIALRQVAGPRKSALHGLALKTQFGVHGSAAPPRTAPSPASVEDHHGLRGPNPQRRYRRERHPARPCNEVLHWIGAAAARRFRGHRARATGVHRATLEIGRPARRPGSESKQARSERPRRLASGASRNLNAFFFFALLGIGEFAGQLFQNLGRRLPKPLEPLGLDTKHVVGFVGVALRCDLSTPRLKRLRPRSQVSVGAKDGVQVGDLAAKLGCSLVRTHSARITPSRRREQRAATRRYAWVRPVFLETRIWLNFPCRIPSEQVETGSLMTASTTSFP